jgi:hypothetical protein
MVEDVIASIDQLILGEVMCAEAPLSDLCSNVLFALIVHVEVAKYSVRGPRNFKHESKSYRC